MTHRTPPDGLAAGTLTLPDLVAMRARLAPEAIALDDGDGRTRDFGVLQARVERAASVLAALDPAGKGCFAILSENRFEYAEVLLAAGRIGAAIACLNWRLTAAEIAETLALIEPAAIIVSARHADLLGRGGVPVIELGSEWERRLSQVDAHPAVQIDPETTWLVLSTGGTTGRPKAAAISHRAEVARAFVMALDLGFAAGGTCLAWPPMYHMGGTEPMLHALATGGRTIVHDGFDAERIAACIAHERLPWLAVMPGTAPRLADAIERLGARPAGIGGCGVMPDLAPAADIARLTALLGAPYCNSFGSTETGSPPFSAGRLAPGDPAPDLGKTPSPFTLLRLVDEHDRDVADGETGIAMLRGPTLFSGYWNAPEATRRDFAEGWFRMGDMFRRRPDGRYDFMDRARYIVKSGGENIYPAEIERILMAEASVADAAVVRRVDQRWGEVPVALIVPRGSGFDSSALARVCRARLAGYKQPRAFIAVPPERLARDPGGKLRRGELERFVAGLALGEESVHASNIGG